MTKQQMAEDVARALRESREHITALKVVLQKSNGTLQIAMLESAVQDELSRARSDPSYLKYVAELDRELLDTKDGDDLIRILYREGMEKTNIPMD
jgi:hypothetical protein